MKRAFYLALLALVLVLSRIPIIKRTGRHVLNRFTAWVLRRRARPLGKGESLPKRVLVVSPHQDDETLGCGAYLTFLAQNKVEIWVLFITDGSGSHDTHPTITPEKLSVLRAQEARKALSLIGVPREKIIFLNAPDGRLSGLDPAKRSLLAAALHEQLMAIGPDTVLTPYRFDESSEHKASFALLEEALETVPLKPVVYEFPIWSWWRPLQLLLQQRSFARVYRFETGPLLEVKRLALEEYKSQFEVCPPWTKPTMPLAFARLFMSNEEFFLVRKK